MFEIILTQNRKPKYEIGRCGAKVLDVSVDRYIYLICSSFDLHQQLLNLRLNYGYPILWNTFGISLRPARTLLNPNALN